MLRNHLERAGLRTDPDFDGVWIGSEIAIELDSSSDSDLVSAEPDDATRRIDMLDAAHNNPLRVKPDDPLTKAITIMTINDFSQLPVMPTERRVEGVISWKSIGSERAHGREPQWVRECMEDAQIISTDTPLLASISRIVDYGYVLVCDNANVVTGIVTASDLSKQFETLAGPFLLIGEIEGHLRNLVHQRLTIEEMKTQSIAGNDGREINGLADLTLGEYCRVIENQGYWDRLGLRIDRREFVKTLNRVREIRNDVMHFDPEGISGGSLATLQNFARFLDEIGKHRSLREGPA